MENMPKLEQIETPKKRVFRKPFNRAMQYAFEQACEAAGTTIQSLRGHLANKGKYRRK